MNCYYIGAERASKGLSFDPLHKGDLLAYSLEIDPIEGVYTRKAPAVDINTLSLIHDTNYLRALITGDPINVATSAGLGWNSTMWNALTISAGGALCAAVDALDTGSAMSLSSGSHHATYDLGRGMCSINDIALICAKHVDKKIIILDFDAHGGRGTKSIVENMPHVYQADVSISFFDRTYTNGRFYADLVRNTTEYEKAIIEALNFVSSVQADLCIYNAGMDVHERSGQNAVLGIDNKIIAKREKLVRAWADYYQVPVVGMLSGGYVSQKMTMDEIISLHRLTVKELSTLQRSIKL